MIKGLSTFDGPFLFGVVKKKILSGSIFLFAITFEGYIGVIAFS